MGKLCWFLVVTLLAVSGVLVTKFVIVGNTVQGTDNRIAIVVQPAERNLVLTEMRAFLVSVQAVMNAALAGDMDAVAKAARKSGVPSQDQVPSSLVGKLPLSFKTMGFDTHRAFDQLALDAEQLGDPEHSLQQLGNLMNNCIACHQAYRLVDHVE
jgi:hypothetical protein